MTPAVHVVGVGMVPLTRPGVSADRVGSRAAQQALGGDHTGGGRVVSNPPDGLLRKGHPLGAFDLAQQRQVEGARLALQYNLGLGGACVVTV